MKNIVTTALLCAAAVSANAAWTTTHQNSIWEDKTKYEYTQTGSVALVPKDGGRTYWQSQGFSTAQDINFDNSVAIDFSKDARYELTFRVRYRGSITNNTLPYCNLSLVTSGNDASILFGNSDDAICQLGVVVGKDVTATSAKESLCANSAGSQVFSTGWSQNIYSEYYTYKLIFETFSDSSINDKIYFGVTTTHGETQSKLNIDASMLGLGGYDSKVFNDIGFSISGADFTVEGGTETVDNQKGVILLHDGSSLTTWDRKVIPEPEPEEPAVPEPSAFGLLAGLGAIALAASRRRRSR